MIFSSSSLCCFLAIGLSLSACGDNSASSDTADAAVIIPDAGMVRDASSGAADAMDLAPAAVADFTAVPGISTGIALTWVSPTDADLQGIVLVAGTGVAIDFAPTDGVVVQAGDSVGSGGQTVLATANVELFDFAQSVPGLGYTFAAWAYDNNLQYSPVSLAAGQNNALGMQTATLSIDLASQLVTVNGPGHLGLSATAVYSDAADTLTIETTVQNETGRLLFNLKGLSTAINQGTQAGNTFPIGIGQPSTYYGPESLAVGAQVVRPIALSGIDGTVSPVTVAMQFVDAPMIYGGNAGELIASDSSGSTEGGTSLFAGRPSIGRQMVVSLDGRFLYTTAKNAPNVVTIDTTTNTAVAGADLSTNGLGSGGGIAMSPDGSNVYVGFNDKAHYHGSDGNSASTGSAQPDLHLIKFAPDFSEEARITLVTDDALSRTVKTLYISPDGSTLAAVVSSRSQSANELWLVNLQTFTVIDTDSVAPGNQPVALSVIGFAEHAAWSEDSAVVYVASNNHKDGGVAVPSIDVVDVSSFAVSQLVPANGGLAPGGMAVANGKLYYPFRFDRETGGMSLFDTAGNTQVSIDVVTTNPVHGVVFAPNRMHYYVIRNNTGFMTYTAVDDVRVDTDGDAANGITDAITGATTIQTAHMLTISPF